MVKNYMESVVEHHLNVLLKDYMNMCKCNTCQDDIKAKALNQLKPLYFVEEKGDIYPKLNELDADFNSGVIMEVTKAIDLVAKAPKHIVK
jgi:competence protein ComFB